MVAVHIYIKGAEDADSNYKLLSGIAIWLLQDTIELAFLPAINKHKIDLGKRFGAA
jgi:hypothetical protein